MTATTADRPTVADPSGAAAGGRPADGGAGRAAGRGRRGHGALRSMWLWCRRLRHFVIPLGIVLTLVTFTLVGHAIQTPDVTDPDYLNPSSDAAIGSHRLAQRLIAADAHLVVTDNAGQALALAYQSTATTIFVPAPDLFLPTDFTPIGLLPAGTTVVLVAPSGDWLAKAQLPLRPDGGHWATVADEPGCDLPAAAQAGPAAVDHDRYAGTQAADVCYGGGLVTYGIPGGPQVVVVGAGDPFRNDRLAEHGNAALAVGLLGTTPDLIWLDRHRAEQPPIDNVNPTGTGTRGPPGSGAPGVGGGGGGDGRGGGGSESGHGTGGGGGDDQNRSQRRGGLADTFPPWLWALLGLLALAGLVVVLAASRRLGPPVGEPLPVTAYGRETLDGRGRLYRRARDPAATYDVLRRAAVEHLRTALHMPTADLDTLVDTVAALTGIDRAEIVDILVEGAPGKDAELTEAVSRLDGLMTAVHHATPSAEGDRR